MNLIPVIKMIKLKKAIVALDLNKDGKIGFDVIKVFVDDIRSFISI